MLDEARRFVALHHRHNIAPTGHRGSVGIVEAGELIGVAIVGRPVSRVLQAAGYGEVLRVCVLEGHANASSFAFACGIRLLDAMGYERIVTYTLASEPGSSVKAAGFRKVEELAARESWDGGERHRVQCDIFGNERRPAEAKVRWETP